MINLRRQDLTIAHFCPCYVDLQRESGGVSNVVRQLCLLMAARGIKVQLICGDRELGKKVGEAGFTEYAGVRRLVIAQKAHSFQGPVAEVLLALERLPEACIVHVHTCFSAFNDAVMRNMAAHGRQFIFTPHGKLSPAMMRNKYYRKKFWWNCLLRKAVQSSQVCVCSVGETEAFTELGLRDDFKVVPNGFDMPTEQFGLAPAIVKGRYILFLGYIDPRKQPELLVRALAKAHCQATHRLVIVGPDAYGHLSTVRKAVKQLGIEGRVIFYGQAYGAEKWNLLHNADCLALPSKAEGQPIVISEALGAGVPVVASRECNFAEVAAGYAGLILDGFDTDLWAKALDMVTEPNCNAQMKSAASRLALQYHWPVVVDQWLKIYGEFRQG